jgi:hypothetical protein
MVLHGLQMVGLEEEALVPVNGSGHAVSFMLRPYAGREPKKRERANDEGRIAKDEGRMTNDESNSNVPMTNDRNGIKCDQGPAHSFPHSDIRHSDLIRHSSFVIRHSSLKTVQARLRPRISVSVYSAMAF